MRASVWRNCSKARAWIKPDHGDDASRFPRRVGAQIVNRKLREWCTAHKSVAARAQCRTIASRRELGPSYAGTNGQIGCCQFECSGGLFSEHWIDGQRHGPLPRRHSGKGSAVPERCPSISVFFAPFGADSLEAGNRFASRASSHLTAECAAICSDRSAAYDPAIRTLAFDRPINPID